MCQNRFIERIGRTRFTLLKFAFKETKIASTLQAQFAAQIMVRNQTFKIRGICRNTQKNTEMEHSFDNLLKTLVKKTWNKIENVLSHATLRFSTLLGSIF